MTAVPKISAENGIEGSRQRLLKLDPAGQSYNRLLGHRGQTYPESPADKVEGTLSTLVDGHNSTLDRLAAIEAQLPVFPFVASSSPGGS